MRTKIKTNYLWALVIGLGISLVPIHSQWLTDLVTTGAEVGFFLPSFGYAIWILGTLMFLTWDADWRKLDWGDKKVLIPLAIIVVSMGISGIVSNDSWNDRISPLFMGVFLFALYLTSRNLGATMFRAFIPFVIILAVTVVINGLLNPGEWTGGLITNYCAAAGFLVLGTVVNQGKWQWVLLAVMLVGLFFVGALEAVFIVVVLGIVVILRCDLSSRFLITIGSLAFLVGLWVTLGYLTPLYEGNHNLAVLFDLLSGRIPLTADALRLLTTGRWPVIVAALKDITFLGHGYSLSTTAGRIVHNTPLIIMHQIGPLAAISWLFVTIYCLLKTKWKYAWAAVLAVCVFDHYLWTQFAPYWWALVGVSTSSTIQSDLIFRRVD